MVSQQCEQGLNIDKVKYLVEKLTNRCESGCPPCKSNEIVKKNQCNWLKEQSQFCESGETGFNSVV